MDGGVNGFAKVGANHSALTPLYWLDRAALVYGDSTAVVDGDVRRSWQETRDRAVSFSDGIRQLGLGRGDVVQVMLPNCAEMVEAQFGVPMSGATLGCLNTRLESRTVRYILQHSECRLLLADWSFKPMLDDVVKDLNIKVVYVGDDYESLVRSGDLSRGWTEPRDEWDSMSLNYTSGTTGSPKGVVLHHRGQFLAALGNTVAFKGMDTKTRYLWTLPMFHCNGWGFPYTLAAVGGVNICLRKVDLPSIQQAFEKEGVTHLCGAPVVLEMAIDAATTMRRRHPIKMMVAAAPPAAATLRLASQAGIEVTHTYGLTEVYGPAAMCEARPAWTKEAPEEQARLLSRQGVPYVTQRDMDVLDKEEQSTPCDGTTLGEVVFKGNMVMKGYYKDLDATKAALTKDGEWFKTGDLGVKDPDGYVTLKDRAKDIVISGGENVSTIEVEGVLMEHSAIAECAVVAKPCEKWGETPCAFVALRLNRELNEGALLAFARTKLAGFKLPKTVHFCDKLPRTSTGKVQKYLLRERAATAGVISLDFSGKPA